MPIYLYLLSFIPALAVAAAISFGGLWLALPPALIWIFVPLADHFGGEEKRWGDGVGDAPRWAYQGLVMAWAPVQLGLMIWGIQVALDSAAASTGAPWQAALLIADLGILAGATGINFAHEMMHRTGRTERALAELLMASVTYPWFCTEHVYGHHKRVATADDPATSRLGESLYAFLPRAMVGGFRSAFDIERARLAKRGRGMLHPTSRILRGTLTLVALYGAAFMWRGLPGMAAVGGIGLVAVLLLETINYIEHYGLVRQEQTGADGRQRPEKVRPHHSWNSSHRVSNFMLINLARHSDHHAHAARSWEQLRHLDDSPQMPSGYGAMVLLSFVPPLWFMVMDPRVAAWRANFHVDSEDIEPAPMT